MGAARKPDCRHVDYRSTDNKSRYNVGRQTAPPLVVFPSRLSRQMVKPASAHSFRMSQVRCRNTAPELIVRRLIHSMGFRFRLHDERLPGTPDIVLPRHHLAIFVHGCFWHRHARCAKATMPQSNVSFWTSKFVKTQVRDHTARTSLHKMGWRVLVLWECEIRDEVRAWRMIKKQLDASSNLH